MSWDIPLLTSFTDDIVPKNALDLATFDSLTNYAGMMAAVFMPVCYDWKGRKFGFLVGNLIALIGSAISVFGSLDTTSDNTATLYYAGRFFAVLGIDLAAGCSWMGKDSEAEEVVRKWVGCNNSSEEFVQEQMAELKETLEGAPKNETILETYNMSLLWSTKNAARRTFIFIATNAVLNLFNVGATGGIFSTLIYAQIGLGQDRQKTAVNLGNSFLAVIVGFYASSQLDVWGRRRTYLIGYGISFVLGFLGAIAMEGFRGTGEAGFSYLYIFSVFLGTVYSTPLGCVKLLFESELLAYSYRAKGKALSDFTLKPSNVVLTYIQSAVYTAIDTRSFWVAQGYIALFWIVHWFIMPETKNRTLEEVDELFDYPSPFYTQWFHRNSGEVSYVQHSLDLLKEDSKLPEVLGKDKS
ncbi:hypothetical protein HDU82_001683 [Entophlyctis luteolus]|nr:hypothetical protein HDU82_001683 [Entophlyctis luteolus]